MPQYTYTCQNSDCRLVFDSIEKVNTRFAYCPKCKMIGVREGMELTSPAQIEAGVGGVDKPKYGDRKY